MKRFRLVWPDDLTTTYRNSVVEDPRPTEIICEDMSYATIDSKPFAVQFWKEGDGDTPSITLFNFPAMIEYLGEV